ncbi:MAG: LysM peptidoglycan-binding domain-containing protein [Desulfobacteraceae bacterium]|nr:LysM peptidoglycan-binding domain-containing protein [Desulfobacteraceae bacterium]
MSENQEKKMFLPFRVDEYQFAVSAEEIESIVEFSEYRSVPLTPESFLGVFSHHNKVVSLISLKRKFGIDEDTNSGSIILTQIGSTIVGFHVDEIYKLISASDTIHTEISSHLPFGCFRNILLYENKMWILTTFEQLFNIDDLSISVTKKGDSKSDIEKDIEDLTEPDLKPPEKQEMPEPIDDKHSVTNVQNKNDYDSQSENMQSRHKIKKSQEKYQKYKKDSAPKATAGVKFNIEKPEKKNKLIFICLWLTILIIIVLIVAGVYFFITKDNQTDIVDNSKISYQKNKTKTVKSKIVKSKKLVKKTFSKSLPDSKIEKKVKESNVIANTNTIEQPLQENLENNKSNELTMYTMNQKKEWVKIEKKDQSSAQDINQLNNIKEKDVKIETKEFTLIIERQKLNETGSSDQIYENFQDINHKVYIVVPGDTLWHLSGRFLGNPFRYKILADSSMIKNPDLIYPGDKIHIIKKE